MGEAKGPMYVVLALDPDGNLRTLELTADDFLRVYIEGGEVTVTAHALLDGTVNNDTVANAPTRGSIIVGNSTPAWDELVLGAANAILSSDGSDVLFQTLADLLEAVILTADGDVLIRSGGVAQRLAKGSDGEVLTLASGVPSWAAVGGAGLYSAYLHYNEEQSSGTNGGTFTQDAWQTRTLNQEKSDTGGDGALASNQITLEAGTYRCIASAPAFQCNRHQTRIQNITDTATLLLGSSESIGTTTGAITRSFVVGRFTIAAQKIIELQHYCTSTKTTTGFGLAGGFGTEAYSQIELWKET